MAEGYFVAHVTTSNALIPIEDATVLVWRMSAQGGRELLGVRRTDSSGITAPVTVTTPALENSLSPEQGIPFAQVDVSVDHPNYLRILAENVQIFPETTTDQDFELIPISVLPDSWDETELFRTPPQNL